MLKQPDSLYEYFEYHLFELDSTNESEERFIIRVVENYIKGLEAKGHLILEHAAEIRDDLQEEVCEMLKKKIYGHFNITAFRVHHSKKNPKI